MSKVMLILDEMPKGCFDCPCSTVINGKCYLCEVTYDTESDGGEIMDSCPLRPLPERKAEMDYLATGWNLCLDTIEEGADD